MTIVGATHPVSGRLDHFSVSQKRCDDLSHCLNAITDGKPVPTFAEIAPVLAGLFLPFLFAAPAFAQQGAAPEGAAGELRCMVNGYDVVLINDSAENLPAGTVISWSVPRVRVGADYTLTRPLPPSQSQFLVAVMGSNYTSPRVPCVVEARKP
ncbi:hypothetical protein GCM10011385_28870 [Nitratireductor aestuarii]|uniref:Ig-like domain-containing protein n=1 Tax=Nitratireductor aestuarii TaxID=1735103 RepID=A0A916RWA1_9HYPH|nr:hypothetical protein [Nitratireductor aestuarii]GGA73184.1 hypothetical protein GCM10011385_28870 [Nitratireductor aestuarii]